MNWWTLLRGIPCSPHGGTGQGVAMRPQTKQQNRQALGSQWVPHGPTLSMVWWCLLITTATHWHESSCEYRICALPGKCLEFPGITSLFRSKKGSSCLELHHTFWDHILIQQQWWSLETDISSGCLLGLYKSSRITQIDPEKSEKPTVFCGSSNSKKSPKSPKSTRCLWLWINHKQSVLYGW